MKTDDTTTATIDPEPTTAQKTKPKAKPKAGVFKPQTNAEQEQVTSAGGVKIENEERLRAVPLFYYAERGQWFSADGHGGYAKMSDSQAKSYVAAHGFNKSVKDGDGNTRADRAMIWLMQNKRVAFAGALAGYPSGLHHSGGIRFLVTESPSLITPAPGKCGTIRMLVESLLFEDGNRTQINCFYLWASESFAAYHARVNDCQTDTNPHCPALAIFGPVRCGKSALIDLVLSPLFGGKKADPMSYLKDPKFNKDLFSASLLVLDDKGASANLAERKQRGGNIKALIWNKDQRMEGKGLDALTLRPFWRLVIAGNDDDSGLQVFPTLDTGLKDKLLILRATTAEGLPASNEEEIQWAQTIQKELPAFAHYLLNWQRPKDIELDPRTRVANFWHPQIVSMLRQMQPETRLIELVDTLGLFEPGSNMWEGRATEFEKAMRAKDGQGLLDRMFVSVTSAGKMLTEISRVLPNRITVTDRDGQSYYRIYKAD